MMAEHNDDRAPSKHDDLNAIKQRNHEKAKGEANHQYTKQGYF